MLCALTATAQVSAAQESIHFAIPAGEFSQTILMFSEQAHLEVLYAAAASVKGIRTPAISGDVDRRTALEQLLAGTDFDFQFDSDNSVLIRERSRPATRSSERAADSSQQTVRPLLRLASVSAPAQTVEEVTVTGSYLHGALDIAAPLRLVDREEMQAAPFATVQDALDALPMNFHAAQTENMIGGLGNYNRGTGPNLRGLGSGATLVLVNGYRQPASGASGDFVDVTNIPWSAVDHIEVLPDGASALYGSDAIAGVVNVILRDDLEGAETHVRQGSTPGGASDTLLAQLLGHKWQSGHFMLGFQYSYRTALAAADRMYTADADKTSLGGSNFRTQMSNPANILDPITYAPLGSVPLGSDGRLKPGDLLGTQWLQNQYAYYDVGPERRARNAFLNAAQRLGEHSEIFLESRFTERNIRYRSFPEGEYLEVPGDNYYSKNINGGKPVIVAYDFSHDFGQPVSYGRTRSQMSTLGVRYSLPANWHASAAASYGRETLHSVLTNVVTDFQALEDALDAQDSNAAFNPFGDGSVSNPQVISRLRSQQSDYAASTLAMAKLLADGPLFDLPAGKVRLALGAERRSESLKNGFETIDPFKRDVDAAFVELALPLLGDPSESHHTPRLDLSLAGRYSRYSDFGHTFNPKVGVHFAPVDWVKLRGSWGTSFKAPRLLDLYNTSNNASGLLWLPDPNAGQTLIFALQGSNPQLKQETATTWTAGIDFAPTSLRGLNASLTYFDIGLDNQVTQPGPSNPYNILFQRDQWSSIITPISDAESLCHRADLYGDTYSTCLAKAPQTLVDLRLHNLAKTRTNGVDFGLVQAFDTTLGPMSVKIEGTRILSFKRATTEASPLLRLLNTVSNPLNFRSRALLAWKQRGGVEATGFAARLAANYSGGYADLESDEHYPIGNQLTFDAQLRYRTSSSLGFAGELDLVLNLVNLTNQAPPFVDRESGYDTFNAQPYGRVISVALDKRW